MKLQSELKAAEEQLPGKVALEKAELCCFLAGKDRNKQKFVEGNKQIIIKLVDVMSVVVNILF